MSALLHVATHAGFDSLEIDSPRNRNALSTELLRGALEAVRASASGTGRGLVLRHTGSTFCSGVDLKERRRLGRFDTSHSELLADLLRALWSYPRPVLAVVDGAVRGGGLGILACADVVLAGVASTFAYSETRVGVVPALVMAVTAPTVPMRPLLPYLLGGTEFDAVTARDLGLVSRVVDRLEEDVVDALLVELGQGAPQAQAAVKRLARSMTGGDVDGSISEMTSVSAALFAGAEAVEGMAAFAERRAPAWVVERERTS